MATKTGLAWREFLAAGKEGQRWEYVDGEVKFMSPMGFEHGHVVHLISGRLAWWQELADGWVSVGSGVGFTMTSGECLCPDAAAVRRERLPEALPKGPAPFPPDVAFEVISPEDLPADIERKRDIYRENGVVQVWVNPLKRSVEVIGPLYGTRTFAEDETAVIKELPGFGMLLFPLLPKRVRDEKPGVG